jgi:maltose alpha-D-glucosyltransferase / alpha-amylase
MKISSRDLWYKRAIIYSVDVETFYDSNGDGIGDIEGLIQRLDYLHGLGVTCLWILPFFPSPNRDNRYDVSDYYAVDPLLGTLGDFTELMHQAHDRGMRVIIDLVVNHTSHDHPWFQEARENPESPYHDFYIWAEEEPETDEENVFPDQEEGIWSYDDKARKWYLHRFYHHQPDLNVANAAVREEIKKIMGFWLQLGVSGFRVDAAPFLIELEGIADTEVDVSEPFEYLRDMRDFLALRRGDAVLLAEANVGPHEIEDYFGENDKLHMLFNFLMNQQMFLAFAREEAEPLTRGWTLPPAPPPRGQWANFLRNHDELDIDRLSGREKEDVFAAFGPEKGMQLYRRGIRRRLPPMFDGDQRRLRMAYSLMLTLPGTPVIWKGEEIGMGEDLSLEERNSVRTPMQWSAGRNGGFSTAPKKQLIRPVIDKGDFAYSKVNVEDQRRDPGSLLNWMSQAIDRRKECPEFGFGECRMIETGHPAVFAHRCEWEGGRVLAVHNLAGRGCTVTLDLGTDREVQLIDILGDKLHDDVDEQAHRVKLGPYGFRWFRIKEDTTRAGK